MPPNVGVSARPDVACTVQPCTCGTCGPDGLECTWRKLCTDLLKYHDLAIRVMQGIGKATYVQVLEHQGSDRASTAACSCASQCVCAHAQAPPIERHRYADQYITESFFRFFPTDGMAPTSTTTSQFWCLSAGRYLLTLVLAALMGLDTEA